MKYLATLFILSIILNQFCLTQITSKPDITKVSVDLYTGETRVTWNEVGDSLAMYYFVVKGDGNKNASRITWVYPFIEPSGPEPVLRGTQQYKSFTDPTVQDSSTYYDVKVCSEKEEISCSGLDLGTHERSIFLEGVFDSCFARVNLKWNDFLLWDSTNTKYYIYKTINKIEKDLVGVYKANTGIAEIDVTDPQEDITFFVAAISTTDSATSNAIRLNTTMARIPDSINADYATLSEDKITVQFSIDPKSKLNNYHILRSNTAEGPFELIDSIIPDDKAKTIRYTDESNYMDGPYYYKLNAVNYCYNPVKLSNPASTIVLNASLNEETIELNWNEYYQWRAGIESYSIYRKFGEEDFVNLTDLNTENYSDDFSELAEEEKNQIVCYYIRAKENKNSHLGSIGYSQSNMMCVELSPNIRFEFNAFIPGNEDGNNTFGPAMDFTPREYVFQIFSRSGIIVYESSDPLSTRWDGYINGKTAPSGAYTYIVQYKLNGKKQTLKGMLSIVY